MGFGREIGGFTLEHRDKNGRLLTTKEAFRQFSYQFHGKMPGRRNKDRRNKNFARGMASKGVHCVVCLETGIWRF